MKIKNTATWLQDYVNNKGEYFEDNLRLHEEKLCVPLTDYFDHADALSIQQHLIQHGMFFPDPTDKHIINQMILLRYWDKVEELLQTLEAAWGKRKGTLFVFPSDFTNNQLLHHFNGVSGLSFPDKLFLFITDQTTDIQLHALLIHEYSHVCRLQAFSSQINTLTLADAICLEGIAEYAVKEKLGEEYCSPWVHLYSNKQLNEIWTEWIKPNVTITSTDLQHFALMYGSDEIPRWAGYAVGYSFIDQYTQQHKPSLKQLLATPTQHILSEIDHI